VTTPAVLALADGTVFHGVSVGIDGKSVGEVVFNTAMTGYQEILSDPSYSRQIVTLTYPHIGNTGANAGDFESDRVHAAGLVVRDVPALHSNWRAGGTLADLLVREGVVGIAGVDTRRLTRLIRERGAQGACVAAGGEADADAAVAAAREFPGLGGMDLARVVTAPAAYEWRESVWAHPQDASPARASGTHHVVAYDYGIKHTILRLLVAHGCRVTVVPATTSARAALALAPDGIFLSNGPGDPEPCDYAIDAIREFLARGVPVFGICLGHQLLGLASGARTVKMKFGHHGANHPVVDVDSGRVLITSQNHGFAVDEATLPATLRATHRSLFDGSLQGIERTDCPAFSFQGHPEGSPGPHDLRPLFERFVRAMAGRAEAPFRALSASES
jgi:carbamoyl-phosphate synthase small subunit